MQNYQVDQSALLSGFGLIYARTPIVAGSKERWLYSQAIKEMTRFFGKTT